MSFSIPGYWEETTPGERARLSTSAAFREALDARLREPMRPLTNPEVLGKLLPSEPSGAGGMSADCRKAALMEALRNPGSTMNRAEEMLVRYSEITEAIEAGCRAKPFDPFAADKLSKQLHALLGEMAEEGARIRKERGSGR